MFCTKMLNRSWLLFTAIEYKRLFNLIHLEFISEAMSFKITTERVGIIVKEALYYEKKIFRVSGRKGIMTVCKNVKFFL